MASSGLRLSITLLEMACGQLNIGVSRWRVRIAWARCWPMTREEDAAADIDATLAADEPSVAVEYDADDSAAMIATTSDKDWKG